MNVSTNEQAPVEKRVKRRWDFEHYRNIIPRVTPPRNPKRQGEGGLGKAKRRRTRESEQDILAAQRLQEARNNPFSLADLCTTSNPDLGVDRSVI